MSYWEQAFTDKAAALLSSGFSVSNNWDVVVVGAGIIGTSTAISLLDRDPSLRVAVVDRSFPPRGATLRNAGFACFGSLSEIASDIQFQGADVARDIVRQRIEGLAQLQQRVEPTQHGLPTMTAASRSSLKIIRRLMTSTP